ncbi:MAG: hypothetical protein ACK53L_25770 [Pirellulaceae bacterium]
MSNTIPTARSNVSAVRRNRQAIDRVFMARLSLYFMNITSIPNVNQVIFRNGSGNALRARD